MLVSALSTLSLAAVHNERQAVHSEQLATQEGIKLKVTLAQQKETLAKLKEALRTAKLAQDHARDEAAHAVEAEGLERTQRDRAERARQAGARSQRLAQISAAAARASAADARAQKRVAEARSEESRERLVRLNVATGADLMDRGDLFGSLPWFVEALRLDQGDPIRAEVHRRRIAAVLRQCPRLVHSWTVGAPVIQALYSEDGRRIVAASRSHVWAWDLSTGRCCASLRSFFAQATVVSPDGNEAFLTTAYNTGGVWDLRTGRPIAQSLSPGYDIGCAAFSHDGRRLAIGSDPPAQISVFDIASGRELVHIPGPDWTTRIVFSPDDRIVVTADELGRTLVWDTATWNHGRLLRYGAGFSTDGRSLVDGSGDGARVWDVATGRPLTPTLWHDATISGASFSPDGTRLLTTSEDGTARIWDVTDARAPVRTLTHAAPVHAGIFSLDGTRVATWASDGKVRIWDVSTERTIYPPLPQWSLPTCMAFSTDGGSLLTGGDDGTVRLWDLRAGSPALVVPYPEERRRCAVIAEDGTRFATGELTGTVAVWNAASGRPAVRIPGNSVAEALAFTPDGRRLIAASADQRVRLWDAVTGRALDAPLEAPAEIDQLTCGAERVVALLKTGRVMVIDLSGSRWAGSRLLPCQASAVVLSPDERRLLSILRDGTAQLFATQSGVPSSNVLRQAGRITSGAFRPDGRTLATSDASGVVVVRDADTGSARLPPFQHGTAVSSMVYSPDGKRIVTVSDAAETLRIWNASTGAVVVPEVKLRGPTGVPRFSVDGRMLAVRDPDGPRILDSATGEAITPVLPDSGAVGRIRFSTDGRRLVGPVELRIGMAENVSPLFSWDISPIGWPIDGLTRLVAGLTGSRIDAAAGLVPVRVEEANSEWESIEAAYVTAFNGHDPDALPWHWQEADARERTREWASAVPHLDALIRAMPNQTRLYIRRGTALAHLDQWKSAADDFGRAGLAASFWNDRRLLGYWAALARLRSGDLVGYQQAGDSMIDGFRDESRGFDLASWTAALGAGVHRLSEAFRMNQYALKERPNAPSPIATYGALLFRAGRYPDAVAQLSRAIEMEGTDPAMVDRLFLAMACQRAGRVPEAQRWLANARQSLDDSLHGIGGEERWSDLDWDDRAERTILLHEAEALILPDESPALLP